MGVSDALLTWNANTEANLQGYRVYYGQTSGVYSQIIDVGNVTTFDVTVFNKQGLWFFAVTAYNTSNLESGFSSEVSKVIAITGSKKRGRVHSWF